MKLIYHDGYDLNLGAHVFPSQKFRLIRDRLAGDGYDILAPEPATDEDLLLVHGRGWVTRLKQGTLHDAELMRLEIPWSQKMADAFTLAAGGTTLAARCASAIRCESAASTGSMRVATVAVSAERNESRRKPRSSSSGSIARLASELTRISSVTFSAITAP